MFAFLTGGTSTAVAGFELDGWIGTALIAVDIFFVEGIRLSGTFFSALLSWCAGTVICCSFFSLISSSSSFGSVME